MKNTELKDCNFYIEYMNFKDWYSNFCAVTGIMKTLMKFDENLMKKFANAFIDINK